MSGQPTTTRENDAQSLAFAVFITKTAGNETSISAQNLRDYLIKSLRGGSLSVKVTVENIDKSDAVLVVRGVQLGKLEHAVREGQKNIGGFTLNEINPVGAESTATSFKREETLEGLREELRARDDRISTLELQKSQLVSERNTLIAEKTGTDSRVKQLEQQLVELQQSIAAKTAEAQAELLEKPKTQAAPVTTFDPSASVTQRVPDVQRLIGQINDLLGGNASVASLSEYLAIASTDRFEYMQNALRGAGIEVKDKAALDVLLEERVPWEQTKIYAGMIAEVQRAKEEIRFVNFVKHSQQKVPDVLKADYDKIDTVADQKILDEFSSKEREYVNASQTQRATAMDLDRKYQRALQLKELLSKEPPIPIYMSIIQDARRVEVSYPSNDHTDLIGVTVGNALKETLTGEGVKREESPGNTTLTLSQFGRYPTLSTATRFHNFLLESELAQLGLRFDVYSKITQQ